MWDRVGDRARRIELRSAVSPNNAYTVGSRLQPCQNGLLKEALRTTLTRLALLRSVLRRCTSTPTAGQHAPSALRTVGATSAAMPAIRDRAFRG